MLQMFYSALIIAVCVLQTTVMSQCENPEGASNKNSIMLVSFRDMLWLLSGNILLVPWDSYFVQLVNKFVVFPRWSHIVTRKSVLSNPIYSYSLIWNSTQKKTLPKLIIPSVESDLCLPNTYYRAGLLVNKHCDFLSVAQITCPSTSTLPYLWSIQSPETWHHSFELWIN